VSRSGNHDRAIPENESAQDVIPKQSPAFAAFEKDRLTGQISHIETMNVVILVAMGLPRTTLSHGCFRMRPVPSRDSSVNRIQGHEPAPQFLRPRRYNRCMKLDPFTVIAPESGHTIAKVLRSRLHAFEPSWNDIKALILARRVSINGTICTDPARRLKEGEAVELHGQPKPRPKGTKPEELVIRHLDEHVVVVEKVAGINTVRHPSELLWSDARRELAPTLQDVTQWSIGQRYGKSVHKLPQLRVVSRLDRDTSGLIVFARSVVAERDLGLQFRKHTVIRRYLTIVPGVLTLKTIHSRLVPDRGDGRRGSTKLPNVGKESITHIEIQERFAGYTMLSCRLETGRTHQIRIHLSEAGQPVCGDKVYRKRLNGDVMEDLSGAPRLALHATELGFTHPVTCEEMHWEMPLPADLAKFVERLRSGK
jgi:23S rRNA pseudouridine1911/1915/1917 synthase